MSLPTATVEVLPRCCAQATAKAMRRPTLSLLSGPVVQPRPYGGHQVSKGSVCCMLASAKLAKANSPQDADDSGWLSTQQSTQQSVNSAVCLHHCIQLRRTGSLVAALDSPTPLLCSSPLARPLLEGSWAHPGMPLARRHKYLTAQSSTQSDISRAVTPQRSAKRALLMAPRELSRPLSCSLGSPARSLFGPALLSLLRVAQPFASLIAESHRSIIQ